MSCTDDNVSQEEHPCRKTSRVEWCIFPETAVLTCGDLCENKMNLLYPHPKLSLDLVPYSKGLLL